MRLENVWSPVWMYYEGQANTSLESQDIVPKAIAIKGFRTRGEARMVQAPAEACTVGQVRAKTDHRTRN